MFTVAVLKPVPSQNESLGLVKEYYVSEFSNFKQKQICSKKTSVLFFVFKRTSLKAKRAHTRPVSQTQICTGQSHSKPSPYCNRIREDTSHHYLVLTRKTKREKEREHKCMILRYIMYDVLNDNSSIYYVSRL